MKIILYISLGFALLTSCGDSKAEKQKKSNVHKEELFGSFNGDTFENDFFNIKIPFDNRWNVKKTSFKTNFGGKLFEADYLGSEVRDFPVNVEMEADKANPFEKPSIIERANESREGYEFLFDDNSLILSPLEKAKIAGEDYVRSEILIIESGDTSFINEYYRFVDGYYLSLVTVANTSSDQNSANNFVKSIKRMK